MNRAGDNYPVPRQRLTESGSVRRVGFELEFAGLTLKQAVAIVAEVLGTEAITNMATGAC